MPPKLDKTCVLCGSRRQIGTQGFFKFPKEKSQREIWLQACGLKEVRETDKICFQHFNSKNFFPRNSESQRLRLKNFVVPSLNMPKVRKDQNKYHQKS